MLLIQSLTATQLLILTLAGTATLRLWLDSSIMEDYREILKLLNEKHLLGLGAKVAELSQCPHCLSVHAGCALATISATCMLLSDSSLWHWAALASILSELLVLGLALSLCIEAAYRLLKLAASCLQDAAEVVDTVANFEEYDER